MRRLAALCMGFALAALAGSAAAQQSAAEWSFRGSFNIIARGMQAGTFNYQFSQSGGGYEIAAQRRLSGLARTMMGANQDFAYSVRGLVSESGALRPRAYQHQGGRRRADRPEGRLVRVSFSGDDITTVATPTMPMGNPPATSAQKRGAVDQLTAIASLITASGDPCGRTLRIFLDGRARFDFVVGASRAGPVRSAAFTGPGIQCDVQYRPIAGFTEPQEAATLHFTFGRTASGLWAPVRIELPTDAVGIVRLEARSLTINGAAAR